MSGTKKWVASKLGRSPSSSCSSSSQHHHHAHHALASSAPAEVYSSAPLTSNGKLMDPPENLPSTVASSRSSSMESTPPSIRKIHQGSSGMYNAPLTPPPRKAWEWHYRSFLSRSKLGNKFGSSSSPNHKPNVPPPPMLDDDMDDGAPRTHSHHRFKSLIHKKTSSKSKENDLDTTRVPNTLLQRVSSAPIASLSSSSSHHSRDSLASATSSDKGELRRHSAQEVRVASSGMDSAVRGGSLFKSVFSKSSSSSSSSNSNSNSLSATLPHQMKFASPSAPSQNSNSHQQHQQQPPPRASLTHSRSANRRKAKSYDDLDASQRNGYERSYNYNFKYQNPSNYTPRSISTPTTATTTTAPRSTSTASLLNLRTLSPSPTSTSSSSDELDYTIKKSKRKAFTEFHNSTMYGGKDSTSPYLGDDADGSVRKQQVFSALYNNNNGGTTTMTTTMTNGGMMMMQGTATGGVGVEGESGLSYALRQRTNSTGSASNIPHNASPNAPLKTVKEGKNLDLDNSNSSNGVVTRHSSCAPILCSETIAAIPTTNALRHNSDNQIQLSTTASTLQSTLRCLANVKCILDPMNGNDEKDKDEGWWMTSSATTTTKMSTNGVGGGNRYELIGPEVLSSCPAHVSSFLYSSSTNEKSILSSIFLGKASVAQVKDASSAVVMSYDDDPAMTVGNDGGGYKVNNNGGFLGWYDSSFFVLWRNYLLEYDISHYSVMKENNETNNGGTTKISKPKGYAHLEKAIVTPHEHFSDILLLSFHNRRSRSGKTSEEGKDSVTNLMMRVSTQEERNKWVTLIQDAAKLSINDLYDYDATEDGFEFGRGRYATVRPAVRKHLSSHNDYAQVNGAGGTKSEPNNNNSSNNNSTSPIPQSTQRQRKYMHQSSSTIRDYDCALKIIDKNEFWSRVCKGRERADTLVRETAVQATLTAYQNNQPEQQEKQKSSSSSLSTTFLRLYNFFETRDNIVLELELLGGTDLFRHVLSKGVLDEKEAARIMRDLLSSLDTMSKIGVAHRDVKPANILMVGDDNDDDDNEDDNEHRVSVKLADFGMATFVGSDGLLRGRCGTPGYVAPEVLNAGVNSGYGNKVDIFSAGVTLYVMLCGYEPFYGESDAELIAANREGKVDFPDSEWAQVSLEGRDLVERMLQLKPEKRIGAADALRHPWILRRAPPPSSWKDGSMNNSDCSIS